MIRGTRGRDVIHAGAGDDEVRGREGNDVICGGPGSDRIFAGKGGDEVYVWRGNDRVRGGKGRDFVIGGPGNDRVRGARGADRLFGNKDADILRGGPGTDRLGGGKGSDVVTGGRHADTVSGRAGVDVVRGGPGHDDVRSGRYVELDRGFTTEVEKLFGGTGNDRIRGSDLGPDVARGGPGADDIDTRGVGKGAGDDFRSHAPEERAIGGASDDILVSDIAAPGPGDDTVEAHRVEYLRSAQPVVADLATGQAVAEGSDTLIGVRDVFGSRHDDRLHGSERLNFMVGGHGDDELLGRGDGDTLVGGFLGSTKPSNGIDTIDGGQGDDLVIIEGGEASGGDDNDWIMSQGSFSNVIDGGPGADTIQDAIHEVNGADNTIDGGPGDDFILAGEGRDVVVGGGDDDMIDAAGGDDRIDGGDGDDTVRYLHWKVGMLIDLAAGTAESRDSDNPETDALISIENAGGTRFRDVLLGDDNANRLYGHFPPRISEHVDDPIFFGRDGPDVIDGRGGDDSLFGQLGADDLDGGAGFDHLDGGRGTDTCRNGESLERCE